LDGDVIYQFSRAARHREIAEQLLAGGKAYRCLRHIRGTDGDAAKKPAPRAAPASMTGCGGTAIRRQRRTA